MTRFSTCSNRGRGFEEIVEYANYAYTIKGIAVVHKVPTEWIPLRNEKGTIASAKVNKKAAVDFLGAYRSRPIAFDAKETRNPRIRFDRVEPHQQEFLDRWSHSTVGGISFVLVNFLLENTTYVFPWELWNRALIAHQMDKKQPATLHIRDADKFGGLLVTSSVANPLDYLAAVDRITA